MALEGSLIPVSLRDSLYPATLLGLPVMGLLLADAGLEATREAGLAVEALVEGLDGGASTHPKGEPSFTEDVPLTETRAEAEEGGLELEEGGRTEAEVGLEEMGLFLSRVEEELAV